MFFEYLLVFPYVPINDVCFAEVVYSICASTTIGLLPLSHVQRITPAFMLVEASHLSRNIIGDSPYLSNPQNSNKWHQAIQQYHSCIAVIAEKVAESSVRIKDDVQGHKVDYDRQGGGTAGEAFRLAAIRTYCCELPLNPLHCDWSDIINSGYCCWCSNWLGGPIQPRYTGRSFT